LAQSLVQGIARARAHGLDPQAFAPKPAPSGHADEAYTHSALAYAKALASGYVDPKQIEPIFTLRRNSVDLAAGLTGALARHDIDGWLSSLAPADPEYRALSAAYLLAFSQAGGIQPPAQAATAGSPPAAQTRQDPSSSQDAPNTGATAPADLAPQLAVNLERRRWLNRTPPAHRIDVNTAAALLAYLRPGATTSSARVVTGRDDHPTPCIEAAFHKLIANPPWRVPTDIAEKEILPKGPEYLAKEDMHWVNGRLEQEAGPKSALGQVKFDVEDPFDIYLHDTPDKSLFARPDRHRSHGCVRVENALDFARAIAAETGKAEAFDQALGSTDTTDVDLGQTIPVRLFYHTAYLDSSGRMQFAADVYGADDRLSAALGFKQAQAARRSEPQALFGP
jgi:murein L,D-transpeptidase YcbB/YkuD